jgi:hypothetical protein
MRYLLLILICTETLLCFGKKNGDGEQLPPQMVCTTQSSWRSPSYLSRAPVHGIEKTRDQFHEQNLKDGAELVVVPNVFLSVLNHDVIMSLLSAQLNNPAIPKLVQCSS